LEPHAIKQEEVETLTTFASQAALALSNARLYEATVGANKRLAEEIAERKRAAEALVQQAAELARSNRELV
jgi:GAF domain-containing protein